MLNPTAWPWQPDRTYYLRLVNHGTAPEPTTIQMVGRTLATDDENNNGIYDEWERTHFGVGNWWWNGGDWDPDGDGRGNLLEAVLGQRPDAANPGNPTALSIPAPRLPQPSPSPSPLPWVPTPCWWSRASDHLTGNWQPIATRRGDGPWTRTAAITQSAPAGGRCHSDRARHRPHRSARPFPAPQGGAMTGGLAENSRRRLTA